MPADQLPQVTVTWSFTGADTVYLAIDNVDAPYQSDLAAAGSVNLPYVCPGPHTFYVVASRNGIRVVQHKTL